jgi:hypothetical protein
MKTMSGWMVAAALAIGLSGMAGAQTAPLTQGHYRLIAMPAAAGQGAAGQSNADAAAKDDLFAGTEIFEKGATGVTEITMDPNTLDMVGGKDEHKAHNMVLNVVRTYSYDKPGMYNMADVDTFRNKLNSGDWHCSVHVRELKTGESTDVCNKQRTDGLKETAIITVEPKSLTFIHTIRRQGAPGMSVLGALPFVPGMGSLSMLPGMSSLPMVAMMDPEIFADMQIGLNVSPLLMGGFPTVIDTAKMKMQMDAAGKQLQLEMPKMQEQMKEFQKQLHPLDQKQMEKLQKQLKDLQPLTPLPPPQKQPE